MEQDYEIILSKQSAMDYKVYATHLLKDCKCIGEISHRCCSHPRLTVVSHNIVQCVNCDMSMQMGNRLDVESWNTVDDIRYFNHNKGKAEDDESEEGESNLEMM